MDGQTENTLDSEYKATLHLSDEDPNKYSRLVSLGDQLREHSHNPNTTSPKCLDQTITVYEEVIRLTPDDHLDKGRHLNNLGSLLWKRFSRLEEMSDLDRAISVQKVADQLVPEDHPEKPGHLHDLGASFYTRFIHRKEISDLDSAISKLDKVVHLTAENRRDERHIGLKNLGVSLRVRFDTLGEVSDLDRAISVLELALQNIPEGHLDNPDYLQRLGSAFQCRFDYHGERADLDKAILYQEAAVQLASWMDKAVFLSSLGQVLHSRFQHYGEISDLDGAISNLEIAVEMMPEVREAYPDIVDCYNILGGLLQARFDVVGRTLDLDKAISAKEMAVQLTADGHPNKPGHLSNLGNAFQCRFRRLGEVADLEKAIAAQEEVVQLTPKDHPNALEALNKLCISLQTRYARLGMIEDLDKAIVIQEPVLQLTSEGQPVDPGYWNNLGNAFQYRFDHHGKIADLDKAISLKERAVQLTPDDHPHRDDKAGYLSNLSESIQARFDRFGELADLDKAISVKERVVKLTSEMYPEKASYLATLGVALQTRFERLGEISDLDRAISVEETQVQLMPDSHYDKAGCLNNLGSAFHLRFTYLGEIADLDKAISTQEKAVQLTPDDHPQKPSCLNNLGTAFFSRFIHLRESSDLERAISAQETAVRLTFEDNPEKPKYLNNLGGSFLARFSFLHENADLTQALSTQEKAVQLTPEGHPDKPAYLNNYGQVLYYCFNRFKNISDLNQAVSNQEMAMQLISDDHPTKVTILRDLAQSLKKRFDVLGNPLDLDNAILYVSQAATAAVGPPSMRLKAARFWANIASPPSALRAYHCALNLLPQVAWLGLPMLSRHRQLTSIGGIVCKATATAIASAEYATALEWLEQGRSIVWGQLLNLRTPVHHLWRKDPVLADQLITVSKQLERVSTRDFHVELNDPSSMESVSQRHHYLAQEWDRLVGCARALPGFEDFLQPKKLSALKRAARLGPVVVINVHEDRCDALVLRKDVEGVVHIPLDQLSYGEAEKWQKSLERLLTLAGVHARKMIRAVWTPSDQTLEDILAGLWHKVVQPIVTGLGFSASPRPDPPRIWWCPTGPLAFLPLHAAGLYDTPATGCKVTDFATSSYTPTLTALLQPGAPEPRSGGVQLLAITEASSLPCTKDELDRIERHAGATRIRRLEGRMATKENVTAGMRDSPWIHLACHGVQDVVEPTRSAVRLHGGRQLTLAEIVTMSLPHAEFAFLSACQTATGETTLSEEAVHLAAGMLLAGYRGVVATMWSINDKDGPVVADRVYAELFKDGQPDSTRAAHALHRAVQHLHDQGEPLMSWVPFVHIGM